MVIRLQVSNTDGIVAMVEDNEIDLGVVEAPVSNKSLVVEVCRIDTLVAVLPPEHELAGRASLPVADVLKYPFIAREEGSGTRKVTFDYLRGAGLEPADLTLVMELGSPESIKGAIEAGMGDLHPFAQHHRQRAQAPNPDLRGAGPTPGAAVLLRPPEAEVSGARHRKAAGFYPRLLP